MVLRRISLSDAKPGDIFLVANRSCSLKAWFIRLFCGSYYTHAEIYLGEGQIAEAAWPKIAIRRFQAPSFGHVAVIRTQTGCCSGLGFDQNRVAKLRSFVERAISGKWRYNTSGVLWRCNVCGKHTREREYHIVDLMELLERPVKEGKILPWKSWLSRKNPKVEAYWCSEFVARCYFEVGIFGGLMDKVEPPELILPADLACNDNFGWVVGVLAADEYEVPRHDKCSQCTDHREVCATKRCNKCPF